MSILLRQLVISTILGLGFLIGGVAGAAMAGHPGHGGAIPPTVPLGPLVSGAAGQGQGSSLAVRTIISQTIINPNVIGPIKGGFK